MGLKKEVARNAISDEVRDELLVLRDHIEVTQSLESLDAVLLQEYPEIIFHWYQAANQLWYLRQLLEKIDLSRPSPPVE